MLDLAILLLVFISGHVLAYYGAKGTLVKNHRTELVKLFWYHMLISVLFYAYIINNVADVKGYWRYAKQADYDTFLRYLESGPGTYFMYVLNYIPANLLELSMFTGTMVYGLLSFWGIYYFYVVFRSYYKKSAKCFGWYIFPLVFYMPSMHFWSAGTGKDAIMVLAIGALTYGLLRFPKRWYVLLFGFVLALMVRPHVLLIYLLAFGLSFLFSKEIKSHLRLLALGLLGAVLVVLLPLVLEYAYIDASSLDAVTARLDSQAVNLSGASIGSSVDLQSYSMPMRLFTFMFRPLFVDYFGLMSILASIENLILLILVFLVFRTKPLKTFRQANYVIKGLLLFMLLGALVFSMTLSNLGIILRMKNMFMPGFLLYLAWAYTLNNMPSSNKRANE